MLQLRSEWMYWSGLNKEVWSEINVIYPDNPITSPLHHNFVSSIAMLDAEIPSFLG